MNITQVYEAYKKKQYPCVFKPWYVNIFGIRSYYDGNWNDNKIDLFNDTLGVIFDDGEKNHSFILFKGTTDPGKYYLNSPLNMYGTALLKPGQYVDTYKIDIYKGYEAICQRIQPVTVYRVPNRYSGSSFLSSYPREDTGMFGIHIHKGRDEAEKINDASAGCQIFHDQEDFDIFMSLCKKHRDVYGNKFTYTLFTKEDF